MAFASGIQSGTIQNAAIVEASGIAASRINPNVLWTHNDSGHPAQLFPITPAGANLGTYTISGAASVDWEDIAVGPGPAAGTQYLYIADIGDNGAVHSSVAVYRVPEPSVSDTQSAATNLSLSGAVRFNFAYPDGPRNAESMFVDPLSKDIYIITKFDQPKHLYRAAYPQSTSGTTTLQLMTTFTTDSTWLTAADISPDGGEMIVCSTGDTSGRMYVRPPGGSITDAFNAAPLTIPLLAETQREAIGFDAQGRGYFTTSEGSGAPIHYFDRLPPPARTMYWDGDGVVAGSYLTTGAGLGGAGTWNSSSLKWYTGSCDVPWAGGNDAVFWGAGGNVTVSVAQAANSLTFKSTGYTLTLNKSLTSSTSLSLMNGVTLTISPGSAAALKTGTIVTSGNGKIDLKDNKMIVTGADAAAITGLIAAGHIVTSSASSNLSTLGIATAQQAARAGGTFGGLSVAAGDVLVMYTYAGDANLDGKINVDDYGRIDSSIPLGLSGWFNGDFNYDGKVNVDDYGIVDFNIGIQGAPFSTSTSSLAFSAVPEPSAPLLALAAAALLPRRRRSP